MNFSGKNFILTPKVDSLSYLFSNLFVSYDTPSKDGTVQLGFSGEGETFLFTLSGNKIIDPNNKYAFSFFENRSFTLSGEFNNNQHRYLINNEPFSDGKQKNSFLVERLIVNTNKCSLVGDIQLSCPEIKYSIETDATFEAGKTLEGKIKNHSNFEFSIFSSNIEQDYSFVNYSGLVTGTVPARGHLDFSLVDFSDSVGSDASAVLNLKTTIGNLSHNISSSRVSGFSYSTVNFSLIENLSTKISPYFSGSGDINAFVWLPYNEQSKQYFVTYNVYGFDGLPQEKNFYCNLENVSPSNQAYYTGKHVTGFFIYDSGSHYCTGNGGKQIWQCSGNLDGYGKYTEEPTIIFPTYSKIKEVIFNNNNIFTKNTPEKIPIFFSGYSGELGSGASGYFLTESFKINLYNHYVGNANQGDLINWKRITGFEITNQGSGYTKLPKVIILTGDGRVSGDFGVDAAYPSSLFTFDKFTTSSLGEYQAAYLTGLPVFVRKTGTIVWEDSAFTNYYSLSGIIITNPGSGYSSSFPPSFRVKRSPEDFLSDHFSGGGISGEFLWNTKPSFYDFTGRWCLKIEEIKNISNYPPPNTIINNAYSNLVTGSGDQNEFSLKLNYKNLDIDEVSIAKLTISGENFLPTQIFLTGKNFYSTNTGMALQKTKTTFVYDANSFNLNFFGS